MTEIAGHGGYKLLTIESSDCEAYVIVLVLIVAVVIVSVDLILSDDLPVCLLSVSV